MLLENALAHLSKDSKFRQIIEETPPIILNLNNNDIYIALLKSIVSQQLSVKAADKIYNRLLDIFPNRYPLPEQLKNTEIPQLLSVGLSNQKSAYMQNVANFFLEHNNAKTDWSSKNDQEIIDQLTTTKGVGVWTVQMILMFSLNRPDVFPVDDLGIQQGMIRLFGLDKNDKKLKNEMIALAENWRPYRTIAARYLWRWKDTTLSQTKV
jgi:DNA-3-methyladenine glycosylase II